MSKVGLDWYKRQPVAYLGDTQGLTSKEHATYAVVVDLLYVHGGVIRNDPKWISGWIADMGAAAVRKSLASLDANPRITIEITETEISQKRAKTEAKTKQNRSETAAKSGKKGGEKSAESRARSKENNDLDEANASSKTQAEKRREEKREEPNGSSYMPPAPVNDVSVAVTAFNNAANNLGWSKCAKITPARTGKIKARLRDAGGLQGWHDALTRASQSPYLRGEVNGFRMGIDFLLQQESFTKLMEGFYDNRTGPSGTPTRPENRTDPALEQIARLAGLG